MASEFWVVEDKHGRDRGVLHRNEADAEWYGKIYDRDNNDRAPHRVVHLVEAGSLQVENIDGYPARVLTIVRHDPAFEPEVAAVVRAAAEEADKMHHCDCATCGAVRDLKLNQLRACGVDHDAETDDG